jgi:tetratricopeptide (TPR) repeat protein
MSWRGNSKLFALSAILIIDIILPQSANSQKSTFNPELEFQLSESLYQQGDYRNAIVKLGYLYFDVEKSDQVNKIDFLSKIKMLRGFCYWQIGIKQTAIGLIKDAIKMNPELIASEDRYGKEASDLFKNINNQDVAKVEIPNKEEPSKSEKEISSKSGDAKSITDASIQPQSKKEATVEKPIKSDLVILVRIIKEGASLKLKPNDSSSVIKILPLGAVFEVKEISDEWVKIIFPQTKDGIVLTGYVRCSSVELESNIIK